MHVPIRLSAIPLAMAIAAGIGLTVPTSAAAGSCKSEQTVMKSGSSEAVQGYMCAQEDHSGSLSIGAGKTHSYNTGTDASYYPYTDCSDTSSSSVSVAHGKTFGSDSWTATNWLTPSNTRHWSAAVLWTPGGYSVSGFSGGCDTTSQTWKTSPTIYKISSISQSGVPTTATTGQAYVVTATVNSGATGTVAIQDGGVSVASGTVSNGVGTITWVPAMPGTSKIAVVYAGSTTYTPATTSTTSVTVSGGTGLKITGITQGASGTASAQVTVAPTTTTGAVALVSVTTSSTGVVTKTAIGQAATSNGTATIGFRYTAGTAYTLVAVYQTAPTGQSYAYTWTPSGTTEMARRGSTAVTGTDPWRIPPGGPAAGGRTVPVTSSGVSVVTRRQVVDADRAMLALACPPGTRMLHVDALTTGPDDNVGITGLTAQGATLRAQPSDVGATVTGQVVCRASAANLLARGPFSYGTLRADQITTDRAGATVFGGLGADDIEANGRRSAVFAGFGDDTVRIAGADSVADGGPGRDVLRAVDGNRVMLRGGPGRDTLVGGSGGTYINAQDGKPGDRVICGSARNLVLSDEGDTLSGPCTKVG